MNYVNRSHTHEAGEHTEQQRGLAYGVAAAEAEAAHDIARQDDEQRADDAGAARDVERVQKPALVGVEPVYVVGEELDEGPGGELPGEEAGEGVQVAAPGEGGGDEPHAGEEEDDGHDGEQDVGHDVVRQPRAGDAALFHWNVSSFL